MFHLYIFFMKYESASTGELKLCLQLLYMSESEAHSELS